MNTRWPRRFSCDTKRAWSCDKKPVLIDRTRGGGGKLAELRIRIQIDRIRILSRYPGKFRYRPSRKSGSKPKEINRSESDCSIHSSYFFSDFVFLESDFRGMSKLNPDTDPTFWTNRTRAFFRKQDPTKIPGSATPENWSIPSPRRFSNFSLKALVCSFLLFL